MYKMEVTTRLSRCTTVFTTGKKTLIYRVLQFSFEDKSFKSNTEIDVIVYQHKLFVIVSLKTLN